MAGDFPVEEYVFNFRSGSDVVENFVARTEEGFAVYDDSDVSEAAAQVPSDQVARSVVPSAASNGKGLAFATKKYLQVGNAAVVDIRVRPRSVPLARVRRKIRRHIFVNFFLKIDPECTVRANDFIGADAGGGRYISSRIWHDNVGGFIANGVTGAFGCSSH